jgi:hypothetical protein
MHTLPKGLWDTTVTFEALITNSADGVHWVIKAPLGLVQTSTWRLVPTADLDTGKENSEGDGETGGETAARQEWSLVEDVEIRASRLLVGTVKGKCEQNWRGIHARFMSRLTGDTAQA